MTQDFSPLPPDFVASLDLVPARGAAGSKAPLELAYVRDLESADLAVLAQPKDSRPIPITQLRETHHMLARLIAEGRKAVECSAITGYSQSRISILRDDPAFCELVAFYQEDVKAQYLDVHQRLATLGVICAEELQDRVMNQPASLSHRELREVMEACFDQVGPAAKVGGPAGGQTAAVNLNIQFVEPTARPAMTIDVQAKDVA